MQQQARRAAAGGDRDPAHRPRRTAGCCARAGRPSSRRRWRCPRSSSRRLRVSRSARANWPVGAPSRPPLPSMLKRDAFAPRAARRSSSAAPGPTGARNLTTDKPRRRADRPRQRRIGGGRLHRLGDERDAGQHRPARESGRRTPDGRRRSSSRCVTLRVHRRLRRLSGRAPPAPCARGELGEPRRGELAGRLARQGLDRDDPARQERGVDAAAQRREDLLRGPGRARRRTPPGA